MEDFVQRGGEQIGVGIRENQWRTKLDDVVVRAVGASEDAAFAEAIDDIGGLFCGGGTGGTVVDQIDAEEES